MHYPIKTDEENCDITLNNLFIYYTVVHL